MNNTASSRPGSNANGLLMLCPERVIQNTHKVHGRERRAIEPDGRYALESARANKWHRLPQRGRHQLTHISIITVVKTENIDVFIHRQRSIPTAVLPRTRFPAVRFEYQTHP